MPAASTPRKEIHLTQQFQRVGGTMTIGGKVQPLLGAYVQGATLGFTFIDADGAVRSARAEVDGGKLRGQTRFPGNLEPLTGTRQPPPAGAR